MAVLTNGTDTQATDTDQIDSVVPGADLTAAAINLVAGTHRRRYYDPTAADIILTLPAPVDGVAFFIKRVANGGNAVKITGQTIDGIIGDYIIGLEGGYVELVANAARNTYDIVNMSNPAIGQLLRDTDSTAFTMTTSFTKYDDWEIPSFSTPQKILASVTNDQIELSNLRIGGAGQVGYRVEAQVNFEYTNNRTVQMQLVHSVDGIVAGPVSVNADGSGKPVSLQIVRPFGVANVGNLYLEFSGETGGGTFNVLNANFVIENF
jgi:hypothetical protein